MGFIKKLEFWDFAAMITYFVTDPFLSVTYLEHSACHSCGNQNLSLNSYPDSSLYLCEDLKIPHQMQLSTAKPIISLHGNACSGIKFAHNFANKRPQKVRLVHKANRSMKCHGRCCKAIISVGTLCLKVEVSLTLSFNRNNAIQQDLCFCPQKVWLSSMPIWSNVRYLTV